MTPPLPSSGALRIDRLSRLFADCTASYKLFWFRALLGCVRDPVREDRGRATFDELSDAMIADAWYLSTEYHLSLGLQDRLGELVALVQRKSLLPPAARKEELLAFLAACDDADVLKAK
ncbi:MAG: HNH endonuclease, partial [Duodenibacillus sp.]|nr:HNH endonuclease [Duodenibacillus sp.]